MLLDQMVEVKWHGLTRKHYEDRNYVFTKTGDKFLANINDITEGLSVKVRCQCDFCGVEFLKEYSSLTRSRKKSLSQTDSCPDWDCCCKKQFAEATIKQERGMLKLGDQFYWMFEENRLREVLAYAEEFGGLNGVTNTLRGATLTRKISMYDGSIVNLLMNNNLNVLDFKTKQLEGYYDIFSNLQNKIELLIEKYGRFPSRRELQKEGIANTHIMNFGGMFAVKERMSYDDINDLVDDNGIPNRSTYEYIVAQWLIHNKVKFSREQYPFNKEEDGLYRSDFTLWDDSGLEYHLEIWGYGESGTTSRAINYVKKKKRKLVYIENMTSIS